MSQKFGIDVSHWQGSFDFARAKSKEGVEFAVIKAGGADAGLYKDSQLKQTIRNARTADFQRAHISMEMPEVWQMQRKRQNTSFHCLRERGMSILSFMMWKAA